MLDPKHRTVFIQKGNEVDVINLEAYTKVSPCLSFRKYKGTRLPYCMCRPCLEKYLQVQRDKGRNIESISATTRDISTREKTMKVEKQILTQINDLLWVNKSVVASDPVYKHDLDVIEAFRRGQKSKENQ